ncbi:MAG: phosphatase PAP2 family protein [Erysipelotrichaceae bacterium]|nr:phosphatase PAP2 family protein [Erysipelotrichaceae bacterium]
MEILYLLEKIRTPWLNQLMIWVTQIGSEMFLMVAALVILWCVNKKWGYYLLLVSSLGTTVNQFLKNYFMVPRPWVKDPSFTIVEEARAGATGYSFPSGHTQSATGFLGGMARISTKKRYRFFFIFLVLLVGFSRMYLGVHTFQDVAVSWLIGTLLVIILYPLLNTQEKNIYPVMLTGVLLALGHVIFMEVKTSGLLELDEVTLDGLKNAYTCLGLAMSIPLIYYIDQKYLNYDTAGVWWVQLLKCIGGLGLMLAIRVLLKEPLLLLTNGHQSADLVRYFLMAMAGGALWPKTFKWFNRLAAPKH